MINYKSKYPVLLLALLFGFTPFLFSQSLVIGVNNTSFTVGSVTSLESGTTISSAFSLNVNSSSRRYDLYAGVTAKSFNPAGIAFSTIPLSITLASVTGVSTTGGTAGSQQLVDYPPNFITLARDANRTGNKGETVWTYHLTLSPVGYSIPPGSYVFTVSVQYSDDKDVINRSFPITITVQPVVSVGLTANASTNVSFTSSSHYLNGITTTGFNTVAVKANVAWLTSVSSQSIFFTPASSGADAQMPCSVIALKPSAVSTYSPLSTTAQTLRTGTAGNTTTTGNTFNMDMRFAPGYNYNPGIYNISMTYTITSQ